jgi:hypothetical protein
MNRPLALTLLAASLAACSTTDGTRAPDAQPKPGAQLAQAAGTPLADLNLVRAEIPAVLAEAQKAPYATPADRSCPALAAEVRALDVALGTDLDLPAAHPDAGLVERGGDAAIDTVRGAAEGVLPFRGWIRKLSGAERYAKEVSAAIAAGGIRRAYLKGLGQAAGCAPPAAPRSP